MEGEGTLRALFVGGRLDGQVRRVVDFRDSSTPPEYHPVETWAQVAGVWGRMDEHGRMPGTTHRMEVVFARDDTSWSNDRIMEAMATGLGVVFTYPKGT